MASVAAPLGVPRPTAAYLIHACLIGVMYHLVWPDESTLWEAVYSALTPFDDYLYQNIALGLLYGALISLYGYHWPVN